MEWQIEPLNLFIFPVSALGSMVIRHPEKMAISNFCHPCASGARAETQFEVRRHAFLQSVAESIPRQCMVRKGPGARYFTREHPIIQPAIQQEFCHRQFCFLQRPFAGEQRHPSAPWGAFSRPGPCFLTAKSGTDIRRESRHMVLRPGGRGRAIGCCSSGRHPITLVDTVIDGVIVGGNSIAARTSFAMWPPSTTLLHQFRQNCKIQRDRILRVGRDVQDCNSP